MRNEKLFGGDIYSPIKVVARVESISYTDGNLSCRVNMPITFNDVYDLNKFIDSFKNSGAYLILFIDGKEVDYE